MNQIKWKWITNIYANGDTVNQKYAADKNAMIAEPKPTRYFTTEKLTEMKIVGVYKKISKRSSK